MRRVAVLVRNALIATTAAWRDLVYQQATPHSPPQTGRQPPPPSPAHLLSSWTGWRRR